MEEIKLIKDIKDIVTKQDADTLSNKLMNAEVELNRTRNFLSDASNFCTDDYDMGLSCKMILRKHIEYLQYNIDLLEKMLTKSQNNKYIKRDEAPELTTVYKKADTKKEVPYYTSSDNVDMLI
jgi:NurA-like 5'-3' nuclease